MASAPAPDHTGNTLKKSKYKHFGDEDKDDFDNESLSDLDIFNELSSKLVDLFKKQDEENKTYKYIIIPQGVEEVDKQELYEMAKSASLQGQLKIWKNYKIEDKEKREKTRKLILFTTKLLEDNSKYTYKGSTWQIRKWMTKEQLDEKYRQLALQNEENKKKYEERQRRQREWEKNQELWKKKQEEIQKRKEQGIRKIRLAMINVYNLPQIFNKEILIEIGRTLGDCVSIRYPNEDDLSYGAVTFYFKKVYSDIDEGKYIHIGRMRIKYVIPKWVYDAQDIFYIERPENYRDLIIPDDKILDRKAKTPIFTEKISENEKVLDKYNYTKNQSNEVKNSKENKENEPNNEIQKDINMEDIKMNEEDDNKSNESSNDSTKIVSNNIEENIVKKNNTASNNPMEKSQMINEKITEGSDLLKDLTNVLPKSIIIENMTPATRNVTTNSTTPLRSGDTMNNPLMSSSILTNQTKKTNVDHNKEVSKGKSPLVSPSGKKNSSDNKLKRLSSIHTTKVIQTANTSNSKSKNLENTQNKLTNIDNSTKTTTKKRPLMEVITPEKETNKIQRLLSPNTQQNTI